MPKDNPSYSAPSNPRVMKKATNGGCRSPWLILVALVFIGFSLFYMMNRNNGGMEETEIVSTTVTGITVKVQC